MWHDQVQYKPARAGGATGWHQDAPLWPSIDPMTPVSAWLPFDDADIDNGCMWMVPGSHQWGDRQQEYLGSLGHLRTLDDFARIGDGFAPPEEAEIRDIVAVPCPVKRGEVHFHHSLTWHGSPENDSPRPRRALAIHYMTGAARFTGRDHPMREFPDRPGRGRADGQGRPAPSDAGVYRPGRGRADGQGRPALPGGVQERYTGGRARGMRGDGQPARFG